MRAYSRTHHLIVLLVSTLLMAVTVSPGTSQQTATEAQRSKLQARAESSPSKPDKALQRLFDGNNRFVHSSLLHPHVSAERRAELAAGQRPFAAVVCCSDSRVPPEIVFDCGLGDLFVLRQAGNVANSPTALASIEFAVSQLDVPLIFVLGHTDCGAVKAAMGAINDNTPLPGDLNSLVEAIAPAIKQSQSQPGNALNNAERANVRLVEQTLRTNLANTTGTARSARIAGGIYDVSSGRVQRLDSSPPGH